MNFGAALELIKRGGKVSRSGWNGRGMFLFLIAGTESMGDMAPHVFGEDATVTFDRYIALRTVRGSIVPWTADQTDLLADDWEVSPGVLNAEIL